MIRNLFGSSADALVLEAANADHARDLADIHARTFARPWTDGEFHGLIGKSGVTGFVLRPPKSAGQAPVAFLLVRMAAGEAEILTVAVTPRWQGYGCGARLVAACLQWAHANRLEAVFLEVAVDNLAALALYRRAGFAVVGNRKDYYRHADGTRSSALVMRRDVG